MPCQEKSKIALPCRPPFHKQFFLADSSPPPPLVADIICELAHLVRRMAQTNTQKLQMIYCYNIGIVSVRTTDFVFAKFDLLYFVQYIRTNFILIYI